MKWILMNSKNGLLQEYQLIEHDCVKAIVKYNPSRRSARINIGDNHRLFFIESAGALSGKSIFKNEYGLEVGAISTDVLGKDGTILFESKKFSYKIQNTPWAALALHDVAANKPLLNCELTAEVEGQSSSSLPPSGNAGYNCLLLSLCWFLKQPVDKEYRAEFVA